MEPAAVRRDDLVVTPVLTLALTQRQWSPPVSGGTTCARMTPVSVTSSPQWGLPASGGTTRQPVSLRPGSSRAAMEPGGERRDDRFSSCGAPAGKSGRNGVCRSAAGRHVCIRREPQRDNCAATEPTPVGRGDRAASYGLGVDRHATMEPTAERWDDSYVLRDADLPQGSAIEPARRRRDSQPAQAKHRTDLVTEMEPTAFGEVTFGNHAQNNPLNVAQWDHCWSAR